ncbi:MAG: class I adenylate-forming enzyme family protein [Pseudomonadota bacterium]
MLSVFDHGGPPPCPAPFNLAAHVLGRAPTLGARTALSVVHDDAAQNWSYSELEAAVRGTGTGLLRAGLAPGDIALMRLGNSVDFPIAYLGAIAVGVIPVPTSAQLTADEVGALIADLKPAVVLRDPSVASLKAPSGPREIGLEDLAAMRSLPACGYDLGDPNRMAYVVYTSGTSGKPRAVAHAHRAIWARQMMMTGWYGLTAQDRLLHAGAFNWTYTLGTGLMDPWTMGATALIPAAGTPIAELPVRLRQHRATIFAAAPGVYRRMLNQNDSFELPDLRHGLSAGEKLSETLRATWRQVTGREVYEAFGMSECSTFISACPNRPAPPGRLGTPQPGRRIAIVDDSGPVPRGAPGVIAVDHRDPGLMLTYLNAPDEMAARMRDGWFLTGDQGVMEDDDQITYLGRADDMMNAGGYRVSPLEVEAALSACPGLDQIAVAEVEVKNDTHIIVGFYTAQAPLDVGTLKSFAAEHLARYKQPRDYVALNSLPAGANGKVLRRALPALYPRKPR